jgi:hypothetical protein
LSAATPPVRGENGNDPGGIAAKDAMISSNRLRNEKHRQNKNGRSCLIQDMSMRSSIVIGLVGGAVGFGVVMATLTTNGSYQLARLEERTDKARDLMERAYRSLTDKADWKNAEVEYRYLLDTWLPLKGANDHRTLECRGQLREIYEREGKYADAEREYRAYVDGMDQKFGPNVGYSIWAREGLAHFLERIKKFPEAEVEWRTLLSNEEKFYGALDRSTLRERSLLMEVLDKQEKYPETLPLLEANMSIIEPFATEQRRKSAGEWLGKVHDWRYDEALLLAKKALIEKRAAAKTAYEDARKNLGEGHPQTLALKTQFEDLKKEKERLPEYWWKTRRGL